MKDELEMYPIHKNDKDELMCRLCFASEKNGFVATDGEGHYQVIDYKGKVKKRFEPHQHKAATVYLNKCRGQWARYKNPKKFVPPSHFKPRAKQEILPLIRTKPQYFGITYHDYSPDTWKECSNGFHLFDEVVSGDDHYLICDACGMEVHIAKIIAH
jgi:hypothetical protein